MGRILEAVAAVFRFDPEREARSMLEEVKRAQTHSFKCEADARQALEDAAHQMAALLEEAPPQGERVSAFF